MNRAEAEKLLGGYATGTLSEAERKALFAAALEDQELFNALADEEALRELLEDPAVREQLLKALAPKVTPFWRRPAVLSAAAGLLVAVGGSLVVYRSNVTAPPLQRVEEAKPQAPAEKQEAPRTALKADAAPAPPPPPPPAPRAAPQAPMMQAAPQPAAEAADKLAKIESKDVGERARMDDAKTKASLKEIDAASNLAAAPAPAKPEPPKTSAPVAQGEVVHGIGGSMLGGVPGGVVGGVAGGAGNAPAEQRAKKSEAFARQPAGYAALPVPTWSLDAAGAQQLKATVLWAPGGHLYLLHRTASGVEVSRPDSSDPREGGRIRSVFIFLLHEGESLDLYQLPKPVDHPEKLPAEGMVQGFRARMWPEQEKTP